MLTVIVGLPGSGKTLHASAEAIRNPGAIIVDDFLDSDGEEDGGGRRLLDLRSAVRDRQAIYACEAMLCLRLHRDAFLKFLVLQGVPDYPVRWSFFANSPAACLSNVERRYQQELTLGEHRRERAGRRRRLDLDLIEAIHPAYEIPPGAEILPVFDDAACTSPGCEVGMG